MNKTQKSALFSLINFLLLIIFSVHSTKVIRDVFSPEGCPNALKIVLFWAFLIFGFMALSAAFGGFVAFVSLYAWLNAGPRGTISVNALPFVTGTGLMIFACVQSVVALVLYARGGEGGE